MMAIMATNPVVSGPTSARVTENVERIRRARGLSQKQLTELLAKAGRPMLTTVVSKIERGERRVDVDDLAALATALGVTPNALLLPPTTAGDVDLTPAVRTSALNAWKWATGDTPLPEETAMPHGYEEAVRRRLSFREENRPYEASQASTMRLIVAHPELFAQLRDIAARAHAVGVPLPGLAQYLEAMEHLNALEDMAKDPETAGDAAVITELMGKLVAIGSGSTGDQSASEQVAEMKEILMRLSGAPKLADSAAEHEEDADEES